MKTFFAVFLALCSTLESEAFAVNDEGYDVSPEVANTCFEITKNSPKNYGICVENAYNCSAKFDPAATAAISNCQARVFQEAANASNASTAAPGTTGSAPGGAASTADVNHLASKCEADTQEAKNFCTDPIKYSTDGGVSDATANMAIQLGTAGASLMKGGQGINGLCNLMTTTGTGMAGLNGTFAVRCDSFINDCVTSCEAAQNAAKAQSNTVILAAIDENIGVCNAQKRKVAQMGSQAAVQANGAIMGKLCAAATKVSDTDGPPVTPPPFVPAGPDCGNPSQATNPLCRTVGGSPGGGGGGLGFTPTPSGSNGAPEGFDTNDIDDVQAQGMKPTEPGAGSPIENAGVPNGGGQMLGGDGGGLGGGDDRGRPGQGAGHNADVLKGERAGGGYNAVAGGGFSNSGGFGGYGAGGETEKRSGFDLSKYLPGGKNAPVRGPAGLNRAGAEIAPPHEDIFKKISDRVQVVCKTNRLMDCN